MVENEHEESATFWLPFPSFKRIFIESLEISIITILNVTFKMW